MMQDWNAYRGMLMERVDEYAQQNPAVMQAFGALNAVVDQGGHLTPKVHELIALAVAVTTRCDGCIAVHTQKATEHGATLEEISEALGIAIALNAGAALTYSARVLDAHAQLPKQ